MSIISKLYSAFHSVTNNDTLYLNLHNRKITTTPNEHAHLSEIFKTANEMLSEKPIEFHSQEILEQLIDLKMDIDKCYLHYNQRTEQWWRSPRAFFSCIFRNKLVHQKQRETYQNYEKLRNILNQRIVRCYQAIVPQVNVKVLWGTSSLTLAHFQQNFADIWNFAKDNKIPDLIDKCIIYWKSNKKYRALTPNDQKELEQRSKKLISELKKFPSSFYSLREDGKLMIKINPDFFRNKKLFKNTLQFLKTHSVEYLLLEARGDSSKPWIRDLGENFKSIIEQCRGIKTLRIGECYLGLNEDNEHQKNHKFLKDIEAAITTKEIDTLILTEFDGLRNSLQDLDTFLFHILTHCPSLKTVDLQNSSSSQLYPALLDNNLKSQLSKIVISHPPFSEELIKEIRTIRPELDVVVKKGNANRFPEELTSDKIE